MIPKTLTLCGWGPYKKEEKADFTVFEETGIFLITGATGAGKTTIFDAISYALYGALSGEERDKEKSGVRSDFAEAATPTYVELVMEHGGKTYRIYRNPEYLRPKKRSAGGDAFTREKEKAILYYPDGRALEGVREVNAALKEILGLDHQQFKKISMIAQGEFAKLLVAPPKDKTKIFREIFDTGIYERFTQALGAKARAAYNKVAEQKHKLEEDVRMLTEGLEEASWDQETKEELLRLVSGESWNYQAVCECLERMGEKAQTVLRGLGETGASAGERLDQLKLKHAKLQEENERILQFLKVCEEKERLDEMSAAQEQDQKRYNMAANAAEAEKLQEQSRSLERLQMEAQTEIRRMETEREQLSEEEKALSETVQKAEEIREMLEWRKILKEESSKFDKFQKESGQKQETLAVMQESYLEQDALCKKEKDAYEDAERRRRLNAVGIAASLLQEGKPCPVCGSLHHPAPAKQDFGQISEEELESLKNSAEKAEETLKELHGKILILKTQTEELTKQAAQSDARCREAQKALEAFGEEVFRPYLEAPVREASAFLQKQCARAGLLSGLIQEKESGIKRLADREKTLCRDKMAAEELFRSALTHYGFQSKEEYEEARMSAEQREALRSGLESYRMKTAANRQLYDHLEGTISSREPYDLTTLARELEDLQKEKEDILAEQKLWEEQLSSVKRSEKLMKDKLSVIGRQQEEYGYVKDLENMASGNNSRRLVFEQYVLAGYFEEILRAANLRFTKMSGGRYEMSRVEQVGDGRVKDNLEIQVFDYYTGKYRSVRTLSGGESFKASLALALGMSDVIQAMNGGVRVDTLFVDEGFGALDPESLDQACDALMGLAEKKQLIGIISHVPELRERIEHQLVIEKTGNGSRILSR